MSRVRGKGLNYFSPVLPETLEQGLFFVFAGRRTLWRVFPMRRRILLGTIFLDLHLIQGNEGNTGNIL
jgi:hypothetical protein